MADASGMKINLRQQLYTKKNFGKQVLGGNSTVLIPNILLTSSQSAPKYMTGKPNPSGAPRTLA
jgi:hypothetical protein